QQEVNSLSQQFRLAGTWPGGDDHISVCGLACDEGIRLECHLSRWRPRLNAHAPSPSMIVFALAANRVNSPGRPAARSFSERLAIAVRCLAGLLLFLNIR